MHAAESGHVPALGQHHAVGDDLDLAGRQPRQDGVALVLRRVAVDVFGAHASVTNSSRIWIEWPTPHGEGDGLAALAVLMPVRDDVADELVAYPSARQAGDST